MCLVLSLEKEEEEEEEDEQKQKKQEEGKGRIKWTVLQPQRLWLWRRPNHYNLSIANFGYSRVIIRVASSLSLSPPSFLSLPEKQQQQQLTDRLEAEDRLLWEKKKLKGGDAEKNSTRSSHHSRPQLPPSTNDIVMPHTHDRIEMLMLVNCTYVRVSVLCCVKLNNKKRQMVLKLFGRGEKTPENKTKTKKTSNSFFFEWFYPAHRGLKLFSSFSSSVCVYTNIYKKSCVTTKAIFRGTGYLPIKKKQTKKKEKKNSLLR